MSFLVPGPVLSYSGFGVGYLAGLPANVVGSLANFKLTKTGADVSSPVYHPVTRSSGKFAVRARLKAAGGAAAPGPAIGILAGAVGTYLGFGVNAFAFWPNNNLSNEYTHNSNVGTDRTNLATFIADTEAMMEVDFNASKIWFGVSGVWITGNPFTGALPTYTIGANELYQLGADMFYTGTVQLLMPSEFSFPATQGFVAGWPN